MPQRPRHHAFTLLELVLVMVVICTVLAIAAPSMRGWNQGNKLKDAATEFITLTKLARTMAVSNSRTYRIQFDASLESYQLQQQDGEQWVGVGTEDSAQRVLPDGYRLEWTDGQRGRTTIEFYSTGRMQPATLRLTSPDGDVTDIECPSPTEGYRLATPGVNR
jgi:type II secretion system protein H